LISPEGSVGLSRTPLLSLSMRATPLTTLVGSSRRARGSAMMIAVSAAVQPEP